MVRATIDMLLKENGMNKDIVMAILTSEVDRQIRNHRREVLEEARKHRYELAVENVKTGKYTEEDLEVLREELEKKEVETETADVPPSVFGVEIDAAMEDVLKALGIKGF